MIRQCFPLAGSAVGRIEKRYVTTPLLKSKSEEDASVSRSSVPSKYSDASPEKRPCARVSVAPPATVIVFPLTSVMPAAMLLSGACRTTEFQSLSAALG